MLVKQHGQSVVVDAPAKLNLSLDVVGKRSDGYHELQTLMVRVGLYDRLRFSGSNSGQIELSCRCVSAAGHDGGESIPTGDANIIVRAARLLQEETGCSQGARIELFKRIPTEAGLGGGSSDAAATLLALNQLWQLDLSEAELRRLGARLGSDVPFFLFDTTAAVCGGRGELVEPIHLSQHVNFVVARPKTGLSTAEVYRHCTPSGTADDNRGLVSALQSGRLRQIASRLHNALQAPAERLNSDVSHIISQLANQQLLGPTMSGSGTACFGISVSHRQALTVAARLRAAGNDRVYAVRSRP